MSGKSRMAVEFISRPVFMTDMWPVLGLKHRTPVVTDVLPMMLKALYMSVADALNKLDPK